MCLLCLVRSYFDHVENCQCPENWTLSNYHFQVIIAFSYLKSFIFESHIIRLYDLRELTYCHLPIFRPFPPIIQLSVPLSSSHPPVLLLQFWHTYRLSFQPSILPNLGFSSLVLLPFQYHCPPLYFSHSLTLVPQTRVGELWSGKVQLDTYPIK